MKKRTGTDERSAIKKAVKKLFYLPSLDYTKERSAVLSETMPALVARGNIMSETNRKSVGHGLAVLVGIFFLVLMFTNILGSP